MNGISNAARFAEENRLLAIADQGRTARTFVLESWTAASRDFRLLSLIDIGLTEDDRWALSWTRVRPLAITCEGNLRESQTLTVENPSPLDNLFVVLVCKAERWVSLGPVGAVRLVPESARGFGLASAAFRYSIAMFRSEWMDFTVRDVALSEVDATLDNLRRRNGLYRNLGLSVSVDPTNGSGIATAPRACNLSNDIGRERTKEYELQFVLERLLSIAGDSRKAGARWIRYWPWSRVH